MTTIQKQFHFGVYGFLRKHEQVLLIKKSRGAYIGKLDLPGGRVEHAELLEEALQREFLEETGVIVHQCHLMSAQSHTEDYVDAAGQKNSLHHIGLIYSVTDWNDDGLIKDMQYEDSLGTTWYTRKDLISCSLTPFASFSLQYAQIK